MFRSVSLYFRRRAERKNIRSVLDTRKLWERELEALPAARSKAGTLALIRLDDIGDYLLFRDHLQAYRRGQWAAYRITLIGNQVWRSLFERYDAATADATIWVDKAQYFGDEQYRAALWQQLRSAGFEIVICPSRTRPLLIDDLLALAIEAPRNFAVANTYEVPEWNMVSDRNYERLFPAASDSHEFEFNRHFASWVNEYPLQAASPSLPLPPAVTGTQVVCFVGASAKSKRWPQAYWVSLVQELKQKGLEPVIAGGPQEAALAAAIVAATGVLSYAGTLSLTETLELIHTARGVISGDTMAAHAAVACKRPLVIIANGVNARRFVDYSSLGLPGIVTLYTKAYEAYRLSGNHRPFMAVSSDMNTIRPGAVADALLGLL